MNTTTVTAMSEDQAQRMFDALSEDPRTRQLSLFNWFVCGVGCSEEWQRANSLLAASEAPNTLTDAERFRWLCEDHEDLDVRDDRDSILSIMRIMRYSAVCSHMDSVILANRDKV